MTHGDHALVPITYQKRGFQIPRRDYSPQSPWNSGQSPLYQIHSSLRRNFSLKQLINSDPLEQCGAIFDMRKFMRQGPDSVCCHLSEQSIGYSRKRIQFHVRVNMQMNEQGQTW